MCPPPSDDTSLPQGPVELSAEQRMLLDVRDTLYEGNWDDFVRDLEARLGGQPHVFDLAPDSPHFAGTIRNHLKIISELRDWEQQYGRTLRSLPE